ncbi:hypothetical protein SEA_BILLNYE_217 [Streptomyces phage BillNye]|uniref:Uncharacterized protein n=2 Tax=Wilnyevirus billnye TaxID=2560486 RepID=A0A2L1IW42_9CAUD|nr:hypothetical protein FDJ30_gp045 [Streptomyces phage BillNye]AVD99388.1 hypothetical protein SEA_BILLNYE_217 [Streptomyces phage BillNye]QBZ72470.1 hypothetical protein SEA_CIRCINUS_217 [Streptomyces phage Circinus]
MFTKWFWFVGILALGWAGFIIWAITRVVLHFT